MPSLKDSLETDLSGMLPVTQYNQPTTVSPTNDVQPGYNTMIRCPLPPIFQVAPDSLNQYYLNGKVPQVRLLSPITPNVSGGGGATSVTGIVFNGNSGGVIPPPVPTVAQQAVITTNVMGPGQTFVTSFNSIGFSFQLVSISSTVAARIEMYGTSIAQLSDLSRGLDQPPPAGTAQDIITDVALDTSPLVWNFQNRIGVNGDSPQNPIIYATITNISEAAVPITVTLQYIPLE